MSLQPLLFRSRLLLSRSLQLPRSGLGTGCHPGPPGGCGRVLKWLLYWTTGPTTIFGQGLSKCWSPGSSGHCGSGTPNSCDLVLCSSCDLNILTHCGTLRLIVFSIQSSTNASFYNEVYNSYVHICLCYKDDFPAHCVFSLKTAWGYYFFYWNISAQNCKRL